MNEILKQYGLETNPYLETISFTDEADWLRLRTLGIGGSDIGAIMGINKYSSPYQVWKQKVLGEKKDLSDKLVVKKGKDLESMIRGTYVIPHFLELGYTVKNMSHHMIINKNYPFLRANLDGIAISNKANATHENNIVIEIKFVSEFADVNWNGEDYCGVPASYYAQVQEYMLVTGMKKAVVCALFERTWTVNYFEIPRDASFQIQLLTAAETFYNVNMKGKVKPPFTSIDADKEDIEKVVKTFDEKKEFIKDDSLNEVVATYLNIKNEAKELKKVQDKLEAEIVNAYTESRVPSSPLHFVKVATVKSVRLDSAKLKEEKPELYEQYCKETESSRITIK